MNNYTFIDLTAIVVVIASLEKENYRWRLTLKLQLPLQYSKVNLTLISRW
jgi:cell shape-determining protein MreC